MEIADFLIESDWLETQRLKRAREVMEKWPDVQPGMFVQSSRWFGDVWSEVTRVSTTNIWPDQPRFWSVDCVRYANDGLERKDDNIYYGDIRRFATRDEINFSRDIISTPTAYYKYGKKVEWPAEPQPRDMGRYELHPTHPRRKS